MASTKAAMSSASRTLGFHESSVSIEGGFHGANWPLADDEEQQAQRGIRVMSELEQSATTRRGD